MQVRLALASLMVCAACNTPPSVTNDGPVGRSLALAAEEAQVPPGLLVAIAATEGGLRLAARRVYDADDHVLVAGRLELRHGGYDSLARAAAILGVSEQTLVEDTELGTHAGAAVLAELGARHHATQEDLSSWIPALEELSGLGEAQQRTDYARRVLRKLRDGGSFVAHGGERIVLAPNPALEVLGVAVQALGTAQFPGAIWFDTSCTDKCNVGRGTNTVDTIVIHDTEGGWDASVATLQNDSGKSVHYIIDADGSRVGQFRPESDITWHSGNSVYNGRSVGIEHVGYVDDPDGFSPGLYDTSAALVQSIRSRNDVPLDRAHIIGHYQVPDGGQVSSSSPPCADPLMSCLGSSKYGGANNHRDPGTHWMWCQYMEKLGGSCACADAFAHFNCTTDKTEAVRCNNGTVEIQHCASACVVEPIGVDDVCALALPGPSHNPRVERPPGAIHDSPVTPVDPGGTPSAAEAQGCSMTPRAPSNLAALLLLVAVAALLSRRRSSF
jgi:N-acetyl-anhydromuramyl-L-alanine amidase AmpD